MREHKYRYYITGNDNELLTRTKPNWLNKQELVVKKWIINTKWAE